MEVKKQGLKYQKIPKPFIYYSQAIDDVYESLNLIKKNYNSTKKRKVLIVLYDVIADMDTNKKLSPIVTD